MSKFSEILSATGSSLLKRRATTLANATKETFEDYKRDLEKQMRQINNKIANLEDLSVKSTESLVVGEDLDASSWVEQRMSLALQARDLQIELDTANKLISEYFDEPAE